jgi:nicotinate-nucleotide pyrophosphorylase (carboxylating)
LRCRLHVRSGARLTPGRTILTVEGRARAILSAERTALNLLGHLSGIATLTRRYVDRVRGTRAVIIDTRKTLPGLRELERFAVVAGGGWNHRAGLSEAMLIKTNHVRAARLDLAAAVAAAKRDAGNRAVEVEVAGLREFREALNAKPDIILLDNWTVPAIRRAVRLRRGRRPLLEASGGVTLENVRAIARAGVDGISVGRLTHSAPALDVALRVERRA